MEITTAKLPAIGLYKDGQLVGVIVQNGKPLWYETIEMGNKEVERLLEVDRAQL